MAVKSSVWSLSLLLVTVICLLQTAFAGVARSEKRKFDTVKIPHFIRDIGSADNSTSAAEGDRYLLGVGKGDITG